MAVERRFAAAAAAGGGLVAVRRARKTGGDVTAPNTSGAWQLLAGTDIELPAQVGDYVELTYTMMVNSAGGLFLDWAVVGAGDAIVRAASSDTDTPLAEGLPALYPTPAAFRTAPGPFGFTAAADDVVSGSVTFQLAVKAGGAGTIHKSAAYPMILAGRNYGPVDDG